MASINRVFILGNVGNVEVKEFGEGKFLVQVSVATTSGYKKKGSEDFVNTTEWHKCIFAIPSLADRAKTIKKGDQIEVSGSIRTNKWKDTDGNERSMKEISATHYSTHKKAANNEGGSTEGQYGTESLSSVANDDLPFA